MPKKCEYRVEINCLLPLGNADLPPPYAPSRIPSSSDQRMLSSLLLGTVAKIHGVEHPIIFADVVNQSSQTCCYIRYQHLVDRGIQGAHERTQGQDDKQPRLQ